MDGLWSSADLRAVLTAPLRTRGACGSMPPCRCQGGFSTSGGTPAGAIRDRAAHRTSRPTTTWATSSFGYSSTSRWRIPARSGTAATIWAKPSRPSSTWSAASWTWGPATGCWRSAAAGRLRRSRRANYRVPDRRHHGVARAIRARQPTRGRRGAGRPGPHRLLGLP